MVKNMHNVPQKLGSLAERLEICRDQDNNPDSAAYKRKIEELVDEEAGGQGDHSSGLEEKKN